MKIIENSNQILQVAGPAPALLYRSVPWARQPFDKLILLPTFGIQIQGMIKKPAFAACLLLILCQAAISQEVQKADSAANLAKAKFLKEEIVRFLSDKVKYDIEALKLNIQGDVIISFIIRKNGRLENPAVESSPDFSLSAGAMNAMKTIGEGWSPATINNVPADKKYLMVFRYRIFINTEPRDYKGQIIRLTGRGKYDKALTVCREAIEDNVYDFDLTDLRSEIKEKLGDTEGAKKDRDSVLKLKEDMIAVINVYSIGITRTRQIMVGSEIRKL